ncbi:uncharacterized protein EV154DRAFT_560990 [Mucor mucedo]|uniref:uncharacterized protein n=1 Tax=Mucor mucedo TaxID=29922 RepID=UPI002220ADEF|nr:uncharacterized protein EV154DRAFT_560990 [Mucor mucedo]KAI7893717.1 hypothetical protein EV154DRAFT_560990 [Mucor mucedo]
MKTFPLPVVGITLSKFGGLGISLCLTTVKNSEVAASYLENNNKPSFNHFVKTNTTKIEEDSDPNAFTHCIDLHRHWSKVYNKVIIKSRPGKPLVEKIKRTGDRFKKIHEYLVAKSTHQVRLARLSNITSQARVIRSINEEEDPKEDSEEEEEASGEDDEDASEKFNLKDTILKNIKGQRNCKSVVEAEFVKAVHSSCINLLNHRYSKLYQEVIPANEFSEIRNQCILNHKKLTDSCSPSFRNLVNGIFDEMLQFAYDENILRILQYLDDERAKTKDKASDKYSILSIMITV